MIEFRNVYIQYVKEFYSLFNFNCVIDYHTLFVGDFYSGTTAIMRTLSKIDKFYTGDILIDNINLKNIKDKDLNIAYLLENPVLFKNKNIFKNLYFSLNIRKISKNTAKNLILGVFLEIFKENFNFLNNYLNIKNKNENIKNITNLINNFLKLKIKKLNLSEQKIVALIRAMLWQPKYILLENFFENLDKNYIPLATYLLNKLKQTSTIIACENENKSLEIFKNFNIIDLAIDKQKKED